MNSPAPNELTSSGSSGHWLTGTNSMVSGHKRWLNGRAYRDKWSEISSTRWACLRFHAHDDENRHLKGWMNYFSFGYPSSVYREIERYVRINEEFVRITR